MSSITYLLLDEHMSEDDKDFYIKLGRKVAALRKQQDITQVQLADILGISQQLVTAYENGQRKIPASILPRLSQLFAATLEELVGVPSKTPKRGPTPKLQLQIEQISRLPRTKQKFVSEMLDTVIKQAS